MPEATARPAPGLTPGSAPGPIASRIATNAARLDRVQALQSRIRGMQNSGLGERLLPTMAGLGALLPGGGLRCGAVYSVDNSHTLALAMLTEASAAGSWCAVVGVPDLGLESATSLGIDPGRLVLVPRPGAKWLTVTAALADVLPLLERAKHGIEFFGMADVAQAHWQRVKDTSGLRRFSAFCDFLADLSACTDYRLLSSVHLQSDGDDNALDQIDIVLNRLTDHLSEDHSAAHFASQLGMSESRFSRFFRKATGNTFTDFVNRLRISRACQLLMDSEQQVTHICFEVGFNNVANFNRRFLETKGMTPSEFRKQSLARFRDPRAT